MVWWCCICTYRSIPRNIIFGATDIGLRTNYFHLTFVFRSNILMLSNKIMSNRPVLAFATSLSSYNKILLINRKLPNSQFGQLVFSCDFFVGDLLILLFFDSIWIHDDVCWLLVAGVWKIINNQPN